MMMMMMLLSLTSRKRRRRRMGLILLSSKNHVSTIIIILMIMMTIVVSRRGWAAAAAAAAAGASGAEETKVTVDINGESSSSSTTETKNAVGQLRPSDLSQPTVFDSYVNETVVELVLEDNGIHHKQKVLHGKVNQLNRNPNNHDATDNNTTISSTTDFYYLPRIVDSKSVDQMLALLRSYDNYDRDPDTVDGMPTYEMFISTPEIGNQEDAGAKILDSDAEALKVRTPLRKKLSKITQKLLEERITPFVHQQYPNVCVDNRKSSGNGEARNCTPCFSLIRRYKYGERQSHSSHYDGHALVTVVVSLSEYDTEYRGGLYVGSGHGQRTYLGLSKGDAAVHQSTLLHGVQVYPILDRPQQTERWSWILWYRDSTTCQDHSHEWFANCSKQGNALCQSLHATKVGKIPGISDEKAAKLVSQLNLKAAKGGSDVSAIKVARAYLKMLPSQYFPYDENKARKYYQLAIDNGNSPDGHYGMAQLLLMNIQQQQRAKMKNDDLNLNQIEIDKQLRQVVYHLETGSKLGHAYSMFNLGMVHVYGYGLDGHKQDTNLAAEWFIRSGLPEGFMIASHQAASVGNTVKQEQYAKQAVILGFDTPWRQMARQATGSGGASGVDLNLPWPISHDGRVPPKV